MTDIAFHPEARLDLDEIWEFIRADSLDAADRVLAEIFSAIAAAVPFPDQGLADEWRGVWPPCESQTSSRRAFIESIPWRRDLLETEVCVHYARPLLRRRVPEHQIIFLRLAGRRLQFPINLAATGWTR